MAVIGPNQDLLWRQLYPSLNPGLEGAGGEEGNQTSCGHIWLSVRSAGLGRQVHSKSFFKGVLGLARVREVSWISSYNV